MCRLCLQRGSTHAGVGLARLRPALSSSSSLANDSFLCANPLVVSRRYRSGFAAFFGIPAARTAEQREQATQDEQHYHSLGAYLDRMPTTLRMLLVWSPVLLLLYFCCKQQREYYLEADERFYHLLMPTSLRTKLRGDSGASHLRSLLTVPAELKDKKLSASPMTTPDQRESDPPGREKDLRHALPTQGKGGARAAQDVLSSVNTVSETKKQPDGHIITRVKRLTYMPDTDIIDPDRAAGLLAQQEHHARAFVDAHDHRSYLSPRRWWESAHSAFGGGAKDHAKAPIAPDAAAFSPPVRPFSTERVTITVAHPHREGEGLLGDLWGWAPAALLTRLSGYSGEAKQRDEAAMKEALSSYYTQVKKERKHDNVWSAPLRVVRDEATGKVVGYTTVSR